MRTYLLALVTAASLNLSGTAVAAAPSKSDQVWATVERRNQSWVEGKREEYLAIHHPDYMRWDLNQPRLDTKADVGAFYDRLHRNETSFSIKVIPERLQFLASGRVAIAHYTVEEVVRIDPSTGPRSTLPPETVRFRFSDIYELRKGKWLYVGGHRDWSSLPNRGRLKGPSKP